MKMCSYRNTSCRVICVVASPRGLVQEEEPPRPLSQPPVPTSPVLPARDQIECSYGNTMRNLVIKGQDARPTVMNVAKQRSVPVGTLWKTSHELIPKSVPIAPLEEWLPTCHAKIVESCFVVACSLGNFHGIRSTCYIIGSCPQPDCWHRASLYGNSATASRYLWRKLA